VEEASAGVCREILLVKTEISAENDYSNVFNTLRENWLLS